MKLRPSDPVTRLLTRVKSRDASASKKAKDKEQEQLRDERIQFNSTLLKRKEARLEKEQELADQQQREKLRLSSGQNAQNKQKKKMW